MSTQPNLHTLIARPGLILALICLPVFIGALDLTIISAVLPKLLIDLEIPFQTGADDASWLVSGYLLAYTVSVAIMGRVSDVIGRRRTYFLALLIFILGSWLVAIGMFAPTEWMRSLFRLIQGGRPDTAYMALYALIAGRVIQALGAGAMVPVSMALVGDLYPPAHRATALGVVGAVDTAGWVLGHLYGGLMVQVVDWPVLFWINIPVTTLIAIITWRQLDAIAGSHGEGGQNRPARVLVSIGLVVVNVLAAAEILRAIFPAGMAQIADAILGAGWLALVLVLELTAAAVFTLISARRTHTATRIGWVGAALLTLALIGLNIGLGGSTESGTASFSDTPPLPPYAVPVLMVAGGAFISYVLLERRSTHPLFDLTYFRKRNVSLASGINLLVGFCLMVGLVSVPLFINAVIAENLDQAALLSGILLGTLTIPMALASVPGGWLTEHFGYRIPTTAGLILATAGFYLGRTWVSDMHLWVMGVHMTMAGIGLGLTVAPVGTTVINAVRDTERGIASALVLIMRLIGMTFGTSIMTAYGLRRSNILIEQMRNAQAGPLTNAVLNEIGISAATTVINEMLLVASVICFVAVIPSLFLRPHDEQPG